MLCCELSALRCVFVLNIELLCDDDTRVGSEFRFFRNLRALHFMVAKPNVGERMVSTR